MKNSMLIPFLFALVFSASSIAASPSIDSKTFNIENYRGRVVYLDFWASWCQPCKKSFPFMNDLKANFEDRGLSVVSINTDYVLEDANKFLQQIPADFEVIYDPESKLVSKFKVEVMPTSFLFDRQGTLIGKHLGFKEEDVADITATIESLIVEAN